MGDPTLAQKDFQSCLNLEQNNKAAKQQLMICAQKIKADKMREKQIYGGMFEKFAKQDMEVCFTTPLLSIIDFVYIFFLFLI